MKKWLLVTALLIIAALASIYIFIPARLEIVQITPINCTAPGAYRHMVTPEKWKTWWPGNPSQNDTLAFQNSKYVLTKTLVNTLEINIQHNGLPINSTLHLLPVTIDSTTIQWTCSYSTGLNPFTRIQHYRQAFALKNNMATVLSHFKSFAEKKENVYGIAFQDTVFKDTYLISTKKHQASYPTVSDIYSAISDLKKYSVTQKAQQTGTPIMNIIPFNPAGFQLMTALPINRPIPASGPFFNQRIPLNHFLVTRVHGGDATVNEALHQFQLYIQDYQRTLMALPFQQLITDRSAKPDTTRWITNIYVPLF